MITHRNKPVKHHHEDECCSSDVPAGNGQEHKHDDHDHDHGDHSHGGGGDSGILKSRWMLWLSLLILAVYLITTFLFGIAINRMAEVSMMLAAYVLAGNKTIAIAFRKAARGDFFNEFTLMTIATLGAFYIGEFSEGVAVMIFYEIGELFQDLAVSRSKRSIKALLDIRPEAVTVIRDGKDQPVAPGSVQIGETIVVKAGEKVALDGILKSAAGTFNTAALTGESRPDDKEQNEQVLAGMINMSKTVQIEVKTLFKDSKLSRILEMVQDATARKAPTQLLISRLAKIYTPVVFLLAVLIILLPYFFVADYNFNQWLYRGMVFLVIACPCALTVSIPLGYFGGIGLASRNGILIKGANFLDVITRIDTLVSDKTGTLTKGVFKVQKVQTALDEKDFLTAAASLESYSTHPVAKAVVQHAGSLNLQKPEDVEEISGHGLKGIVNGKTVLAGNLKLLDKFSIPYPEELNEVAETIVAVAVGHSYAGYLTIADEIKDDAAETVASLKKLGIETIMLSGDKQAVVSHVGEQLHINKVYGNLLPEDKVTVVQKLKDEGRRIAFAGDGVNDAPVIALADVGIAMGALGSDATIETADIVIQNDQPSKILSAIRAGKVTKQVVYQNIGLAMGIKIVVMLLGAGGIATLWEAVFADVGVALFAILNAFRIQGKKI
ncbi:heavy metal translocating P-type ATPase [Dyadobacter sediminis]|uniref:P-type Zn(2+) transporter n=1 Tax=Dyadobacter sediminis TaxID=1493691 RepID=A0A5R9KKT7_9BACT|nr:heavy metal translocating P-type ATPase [Dyadobacter sediminis]TLU96749.1 cadmium-translocating P-type ATPase [Dyadobacter sediminis]GGB84854.1 cadmium/zinc/cobalt-transporting ATPase [Dyadobacter sediminis]